MPRDRILGSRPSTAFISSWHRKVLLLPAWRLGAWTIDVDVASRQIRIRNSAADTPCDRRASLPTADPQLKSSRLSTNLLAAEMRRGLDRPGPSLRKVAQRTHPAGHPQPHELPAQADPERQTAEEDKETDAIFANVKEVQQQAAQRSAESLLLADASVASESLSNQQVLIDAPPDVGRDPKMRSRGTTLRLFPR